MVTPPRWIPCSGEVKVREKITEWWEGDPIPFSSPGKENSNSRG